MMHVEGSRHVGLGFGAITRQDIAPNTRFRLNEAEVRQQTRLSAEKRDQIVRQTQGQVFYTPAEGGGRCPGPGGLAGRPAPADRTGG